MAANMRSASVHDAEQIAIKRSSRPSLFYFYLGSVVLMGFLLQASLRVSWPELEALQQTIGYKIASGSLLCAYLLTQWQVPYQRLTRTVSNASARLAEHKLVGVLGPLILYLHSSRLGTGYTWLLSTLFLGNAALSLLNRETLGIKARWFWFTWLTLHITLAVTVTAMGALHVCTALYYPRLHCALLRVIRAHARVQLHRVRSGGSSHGSRHRVQRRLGRLLGRHAPQHRVDRSGDDPPRSFEREVDHLETAPLDQSLQRVRGEVDQVSR
jgi:hypothetical protein